MAGSRLIHTLPHESQHSLELSLRQAFDSCSSELKPPFSLSIPTPEQYTLLNKAILYGVLTQPHLSKTHIKLLHAIVTDGYALFLSLLVDVVNELYVKLFDFAKTQVLWVAKVMIDVSGVGFRELLVSLLRQIVGGDFSSGNMWLCYEVVSLFMSKFDYLFDEEPSVLSYAVYCFLRLLGDHCRISNDPKLDALKNLEIEFCIKMLREQFGLCFKIGRDLIRLLQDLIHVPEFRDVWKDLILNPNMFGTAEFLDISRIYGTMTSREYFLLRLTPEMERWLQFLLTHVNLGSQKRHQTWFARKFLYTPDRENLVCDMIRFVCCAHHTHKENILSKVIPRWAVIGWLLKSCRKNYVEANAKLALFYDWLFFDEKKDDIMNIEPAMLLMVYSIPKYVEMTNSLLEFLFMLVDNYDVDHKEIISRGVLSSFKVLIDKGVIQNFDTLTSCGTLSRSLRKRLERYLIDMRSETLEYLQPMQFNHPPVLASKSSNSTSAENISMISKEHPVSAHKDVSMTEAITSSVPDSCSQSVVLETNGNHDVDYMFRKLDDMVGKSNVEVLQTLEEILIWYTNVNDESLNNLSSPEYLSLKIQGGLRRSVYTLFKPLEYLPNDPEFDDELGSPTALIICGYIFSRNEKLRNMLSSWSRSGFLVGARLLSYASRLAREANVLCNLDNALVDNHPPKLSAQEQPLLLLHVQAHLSFSGSKKEKSFETIVSASQIDREAISKLVDEAFLTYRTFLLHLRTGLDEARGDPSDLLYSDLLTCLSWKGKNMKFLFQSIFSHLSDLFVRRERIIKLLIDNLCEGDLVMIQFDIVNKKYSVIGQDIDGIAYLIRSSLDWEHIGQYKLWSLIRSELAVFPIQLEKLILEFFCSGKIDGSAGAIAVGGFLSLCASHLPTPELAGAIMLLPDNAFAGFVAAALATWAASNDSLLFDSLADFAQKLENENGKSVFSDSDDFGINPSATLWLLSFLSAKGLSSSTMLKKFSLRDRKIDGS